MTKTESQTFQVHVRAVFALRSDLVGGFPRCLSIFDSPNEPQGQPSTVGKAGAPQSQAFVPRMPSRDGHPSSSIPARLRPAVLSIEVGIH